MIMLIDRSLFLVSKQSFSRKYVAKLELRYEMHLKGKIS